MRSALLHALSVLTFISGIPRIWAAGSLEIPGVAPVAAVQDVSPPVVGMQAVTVSPLTVDQRSITGAPPQSVKLTVSGGTAWTAATTGSPWLSVVNPSGVSGDLLELRLSPGSLAPGNLTGSVNLTSDGSSTVIPVKFTIEAPAYTALKADPVRPLLYALQRPSSLMGSLVVVNSTTAAIERLIPLSSNPTGFDLTPDGQFMYVITKGGRKMHRIDLSTWSAEERVLPATNDNANASEYHVAAGTGTMVYWTDGAYAPALHSLDFATGMETGPAIIAENGKGIGFIARNPAGTGLVAWNRLDWPSSSITGANAVNIKITGASATLDRTGIYLDNMLDTKVLFRVDGSGPFIGNYLLSPDLSKIDTQYPGPVYAVTPGRGLVFGATAAWRDRALGQVWQAPAGVDARISAVTGDASAFYYFDKPAGRLIRVAMSSIGDVPGPQPENGEIVEAMPPSLAWTPKPGALSYEVYFGTDPAAVLAATGSGSPFYLGSATTSSLPLNVPFRPAGLWWWRVDTVLAGSTTKGSVWKFSGALSSAGLLRGPPGGDNSIVPPALAMEGSTILCGYGFFSKTDQFVIDGQVHVYEKRNGVEEWDLIQRIDKPVGAAASAGFGRAISMKGDTAWISAPGDGTSGRIHEYRQDSATRRWQATGRILQSPTPAEGAGFGSSLAFDGTVIVVGPLGGGIFNPSFQPRAVEIFDAVTLTRHVRITETIPNPISAFGAVLALGNGVLAVSNSTRTVSAQPAGAIDIWTRGSGTTWTRTFTIPCPQPTLNRDFGSSLALSGDWLYAGTSDNLSAGKVFSFQKGSGTSWTLRAQIPRAGSAAPETYSSSLALSGDLLAIGAPSVYSNPVWLHRNLGTQGWTSVAPALPDSVKSPQDYGVSLALTKRYLATAYRSDNNKNSGFTVHLHDPAGNLPPFPTSSPVTFGEVGRFYQYDLMGADENAGDILTFSAASSLPSWLSLKSVGNGRALLSGTPSAGSAGDVAIRLRLQDSAGDSSEQTFSLRVVPSSSFPEILNVTGDQTSDDGKPLAMGVTVASGAPVTYQWYRNGIPLSGQTSATFEIGHVQRSDAGSYQVRVTRNGVWIDTTPMILTINDVADRYGGDWPTFGATPSHAGSYPAALGSHTLLPAWNIPKTGNHPVVTGDGRVYAVSGGGFEQASSVSAYAADTGTPLWTVPLPISSTVDPPTFHRGKIFLQRGVLNNADLPDLRCYDAATGELLWSHAFGPLSSFGFTFFRHFAPTVDDTGIYTNGGIKPGLYRFGLDGTLGYFQSLAQVDAWTPLLHQGKLYTWGPDIFTNHERQSGTPIYSLGAYVALGPTYSMDTVPVAEGNLAVMRSSTEVLTVDLTSRRVLWRKSGSFQGSPALKKGTAYVITTTGVQTFDALTGIAGKLYPTKDSGGANVTAVHQPVILEDTLLVSSNNLVWSFDLASGTMLQRLAGGGPLTYSDGILLASSNNALKAWKVNQPTRLTAVVAAMSAIEDVPFQWELQVADPDADVPTLSITGLPVWLTASPLQQGIIRFSGTPLNSHAGPFSISVVADDLKSSRSTLAISGSVTPVNDQPTASNRTLERSEDAPAEDMDLTGMFSDEESAGAALNYSIVSASPTITGAALDGPSDTTLRISYKADASGTAIITVRAADPEGLFADSVITINVAPVNDPPAGSVPPLALDEDAAAVEFNLDDFFADIETADSGLVFQVTSTQPSLATALLSGHVLRVTPQPNAFGGLTVNIRCQDPEGALVDFPLPVTLRPVNDLPTGTVADLNPDEDFLPLVIDLAAAFDDIETPDASLRFSAASSAPAVVQTSLSGPRLTLISQKDANGSLFVDVTCTDADGGRHDVRFNLNVTPVNDPPVIPAALPAIAAGDSASDAVIDFGPFATDPDLGDLLTWRVVSNTNPSLFTKIDFNAQGRLIIQYAPYVSGQATIGVEVRDLAGTSAQRSFTVELPALPAPSIATSSTLMVNRQTGLWEQRITVMNTGKRAIGGFEISVTGLPAGASLYNASGSEGNRFTAASYQPLAPGASLTMILEYYVPNRAVPNPQLQTAVLLPQPPRPATGGSDVRIERMDMMEPGAFLLEFSAVPGELYQVQYSSGEEWTDSLVRIRAAGNRVQWIDRGAPRTNSPPHSGKSRFYRVKHLTLP